MKKFMSYLLILVFLFSSFPVNALATGDTTPPSIVLTPNGGNVLVGQDISIFATDATGINHIGYAWNGDVTKTIAGSKTSVITTATIKVPSVVAKHILNIYAQDNLGNYKWEEYTYNVTSADTTPPTLTLSKTSGSLNAGEIISVTAQDSNGINHIGYVWDNGSSTTTVYSTNAQIPAPTSAGSHTLKIYAKDNSPNYNFKWEYYNYTVGTNDTSAPTVSLSKTSGNLTPGENITVTAYDSNGVNRISYSWNSDSTKYVYASTAQISAPSSAGSHTLKVCATDTNSNTSAWQYYTFNVASNDTTAPTLTLSKTSGNLTPGETISVSAYDVSGINHIGYAWDNASTTPVYSTSATIPAPTSAGSHTLKVYAKDNSSNYNFKWEYYNYTVVANDTSAPTISVSPNGGSVNVNSNIYLTVSDDSKLSKVSYIWDNNSEVNLNINSNSTYQTFNISVPNSAGYHTLKVRAIDDSANKNSTGYISYSFNVNSNNNNNNDTTAPSVYASPSSGTVNTNDVILLSATDNTGIYSLTYYWNNNSSVTYNSSDARVTVPNSTGYHTLYAYATDSSSNRNISRTYSFSYYVNSNSNGYDNQAPVVTVNPPAGNITAGKDITISSYDSTGIYSIEYNWDNESTRTFYNTSYVIVQAPSSNGNHRLYVTVTDSTSSRNRNTYSYNYYVGNSNDQYPASLAENAYVNTNIKTLKVELVNDNRKTKNKVGDDILYRINYYNGERNSLYDVSVVFDIPTGFSVVNAYNGSVDSNTVRWNIGTVSPYQSDKLYVKLRTTDYSMNQKTVTLKARVQKSNMTTDTSSLQNYIYRDGDSGYHDKYINGYPDNTFAPSKGITRAELAAMLVRLFNLNANGDYYNNPYKDINRKHWAYSAILSCNNEGLFGGYPDGTFKPDKIVTRAEFSAILSRKLGLNNSESIWIHFEDLEGHWAMNNVEQMFRQGIISGYSDNTVKPNSNLTRAEAVTMLNRFMFRGQNTMSNVNFRDLNSNHWAYREIVEASTNHNYTRNATGDER